MSRARTWIKMAIAGVGLCVGGPALVYYVSPTEEELFNRFSPDLQKRNLEMREFRLQRYENFITKLKEYSKSDKPIWVAAAEAAEEEKRVAAEEKQKALETTQAAPEEVAQKVDEAKRAAVDEKQKVMDHSPSPQEKLKGPSSLVK